MKVTVRARYRLSPRHAQRFRDRFDINSVTGCWLWKLRLSKGYGRFGYDKRVELAHRVAYWHWVGKIPKGLELDHLCRTRHCVNPNHLEAVTQQENIRRGEAGKITGARQRAKIHCKHGHKFTPQNTYHRSSGGRSCITCMHQRHVINNAKRNRKRLSMGLSWSQFEESQRNQRALKVLRQ